MGRRGRRGAAHDRLCFRAHRREQAIGQGGVEALKPHQPAAHDLIGRRGAQKADRRAHAGVERDEDSADANFLGDARGVQRSCAPERDQRARSKIFPALDGMHTRRIRHVLVHNLADAECCMFSFEF